MIEFFVKGLVSVIAIMLLIITITAFGYLFLAIDWLWSKLDE